ncbi:MAG: hypothetical protein AAF267_20400, partial [Deinococcota bacterium]
MIVEHVMNHVFAIIHCLDKNEQTSSKSSTAILEAALQVQAIRPEAKLKMRLTVRLNIAYEYTECWHSQKGHQGLTEAIEIASRILEHGQPTIYSADHPFHQMVSEQNPVILAKEKKKDSVEVIKDIDYFGGISGGAAGSFIPAIGTGFACT